MTLPLFDDRTPRRVTLVKLAAEIARSLVGIGRIAVEGEVHRPTTSRGGWVFFTLRDRVAQIDVRVPAAAARRSRIAAGERASVVGTLQWSNERGQLQLVAEEVVPVGAGAIAAMIADTRARLEAEGLIGRRRRQIPILPAAVGVVCGSDAAVRKDIESVVAARCPGYPIVFQETTVTGPGSEIAIAAAIETVSKKPAIEVIILARGGGDAPSLLPWSREEVCRAVAACPVPVVSAIGHDGDRPLCDEVADLRCGTPSLAATVVLPNLDGLTETVDLHLESAGAALKARLVAGGTRLAGVDASQAVKGGLDRAGERLGRAELHLAAYHPFRALELAQSRISGLDWRRPMWEALGRADGRLKAELRHMQALSPQRTLDRGYAVAVRTKDGLVLRRADEVDRDEAIKVTLARGAVVARVEEIRP